jgi:hypothetical protein
LKIEEERLAREKAEAERKAKEEAERLARAKAELETAEREAAQLKADRLAAQKAEGERLAREKAEAERKEKVEAEHLAALKEEQEKRAKIEAEQKANDEIALLDPTTITEPKIKVQTIADIEGTKKTGARTNLGDALKKIVRPILVRKRQSKIPVGVLALIVIILLGMIAYSTNASIQSGQMHSTQTAVVKSTGTAVARSTETAIAKTTSTAIAQSTQTIRAQIAAVTANAQASQVAQTSQAARATQTLQASNATNAQATANAKSFFESFDNNSRSWPTDDNINSSKWSGSISIINGYYIWDVKSIKEGFTWKEIYNNPPIAADFYVSVEVKRISGTPEQFCYGIYFRNLGVEFYAFIVCDSQRFFVGYYNGTQWKPLQDWKTSLAIHTDSWNYLEISGSGNKFDFYINKEAVSQITDNSLSKGYIYLNINVNDTVPGKVMFDNLQIDIK